VIADTWSPEEIRQAEAMARLEGWGQEKRRTASILAELHNVARIEQWLRACAASEQPPPMPTMLSASDFLPGAPVKRNRKAAEPAKQEAKKEQVMNKLSSIMNGLCGYQ
jgi:hypothetical protein